MKLLKWMISLGSGLITIQVFQTLDYQSLAYFFSSIIINPILFILGVICFFVSIIGFSSFFKDIIHETYNWVINKEKPTYMLILNCSSLLCVLFMYSKSFWITSEIVVFSLFYGMMTIDLKREYKLNMSENDAP